MNDYILIFLILQIIITVISSIIKYIMKNKNKGNNNINLLDSTVSYEKYIEISKRTSKPNAPVRLNGDYLDYFLSGIVPNSTAIENRLLEICEEENNERKL